MPLSDEERGKLNDLEKADLIGMIEVLKDKDSEAEKKRDEERKAFMKSFLSPKKDDKDEESLENSIDNNDLSKDEAFQRLKEKFKGR